MTHLLRCLLMSMVSSWWILALPANSQCVTPATCTPGSAPANPLGLGTGIFHVQVANLDTITNGATDGYQDYSCRRAVQLTRGTTYILHVATSTLVDEQVQAWADFNQDGVFNPLTELVLTSTGRQHTGMFTVPVGVPVGASLRLRIAADYIYSPVPGPCTTPQYSQTEDYRVVITAASPPPPQAAFSAIDSVSCGAAVQLRDHSRNAPATWRWSFGDGTTSTQQNPAHTYVAAGTYAVRLRVCNASGCDSLTKSAFILVRSDGPKPSSCQPITQAYCCQFGIDRVRLAGLDHRPGGGAAGYQDASCAQRTTLRADWPDTLRLTTGGQQYAHDVRVYLDLNDDGQFTPATELLYQGLGVVSPVIPIRLSSLTMGLVYNKALRLRIWADYAGSPATGPCGSPQWGQVADYSVQVLPNTILPHAAFAISYAQVCDPVQVTLINANVGNTASKWDFGDGSSSTAVTPPAHTYVTPGVYTIRLVATNAVGSDTVRQELAVAAACPTYCTAIGYGGNTYEPVYFTRVKIGSYNNTVPGQVGQGNRDFTTTPIPVRQGQVVALHAESPTWYYTSTPPDVEVTAYADFDHDGLFSRSEMLLRQQKYSPYDQNFRVPHGAKLGATRLRLISRTAQGRYTHDGCQLSNFIGTAEDYTLLVLPAQAPPIPGFKADLTVSCSGQVQFTDTTGATPQTWLWNFGDGATSTQANPSHTYTALGQYPVTLQVSNRYGTSTLSRPNYITVTGLQQGPRPAAVQFLPWQLFNGYGLASFQLQNLNYLVGPNQPGYRDETCQQPAFQLTAGTSYAVTIAAVANFPNHYAYLWLDANDDGILTANERLFGSAPPSSQTVKQGTFTVPATALTGRPLRLRLMLHGLLFDDSRTPAPIPDPQSHLEEYDQIRDFTLWVNTVLATSSPAALASNWSFYPNPATESVTLVGLHAGQTAEIWNTCGQLTCRLPLMPTATGEYRISTQHLAQGVYLLKITGESAFKKLIIQ